MREPKLLYVNRDEYALLLRLMAQAEALPMPPLQMAYFIGLVREQCAPEILEELIEAVRGGYQLHMRLMPVAGPLCLEACES